jgi:hypothetical protein
MRPREVAIVALISMGVLATPARATNRTFEAEGMAVAGPGAAIDDRSASGGRALDLAGGAVARDRVITGAPAHWLSIRARGKQCFGSSRIEVRIDGVTRYSGPVSDRGYQLAEARLPALPRGVHTVEIYLADAGGLGLGCQHRARIDRVTIHAPFADDSFRNRPLTAGARIGSNSARLVTALKRQALDRPGTVWVSTSTWSVPVYLVPASQAPAAVRSPTWEVQRQLNGAPIPPNARPADPKSGDSELVVYQPATDRIWEFHHVRKTASVPRPVWTTSWGGRMDHVSGSPGYFTNAKRGMTFGASASRLSLFGGLQTIAELQARRIDHAVDLILPNVTQGSFVWPAQASDQLGREIGRDPIPEGTRFRLPASVDIDALGLPPYTRTLARAIQRYGLVVRDRGGVVSFKAEDPRPRGDDPYEAIFGGMYPNEKELLARFPWGRLQVLAAPKRTR